MSDVTFTKVALPNGWLGNMAPYPIKLGIHEYKTSEALFQALRYQDHPDVQEMIRSEKSPMAAKMKAKKFKSLLPEETFMSEEDLDRMRVCLKLKIEQHPKLKQALLNTGDDNIIEDSSARPNKSGLYWGAANKEGQWIGENHLGKLWMELRNQLKS